MRRSKQKITEDFRRIVEAARASTTIEGLSKETGLSKFQINNTLAKVKLQEILKGEAAEEEKVFLLDASATASLDLKKYLKDPKIKIVITSITIEELSRIKHRQDYDGFLTRQILKMAQSQPEKFILEKTPKYFKDPVMTDNFLIEHCKNKDYTVLTCDADMILRAKNEGVNYVLLGHHSRKLLSLGALNCPKGKVNNKVIFVSVYSNKWLAVLERDGKIIKNADGKPVQLHDIIYRANKINENHVQIKKFEVVSLTEKSNCVHIDTFDFHKPMDIDQNLPYADIVLQAFLCLECKKKD